MFKLQLDKDKQKLLETFLGEGYKELYNYQKWLMQLHITKKDVDKFKKIEELFKNEKVKFSQDKECD